MAAIEDSIKQLEHLVWEQGQHERGLQLADELLQHSLSPDDECSVFYAKAVAFWYLGNVPGALFMVRRAIKLNPADEVSWVLQGYTAEYQGDTQLAIYSAQRALRIHPDCQAARELLQETEKELCREPI